MRVFTIAVCLGAIVLMAAVEASAATHLTPGALYTSKAGKCTSPGPGITCEYKFRASSDGQSLRFVGKTVVDSWICNGGGGEALLGGKKGQSIPLVKVSSGGKLQGSVRDHSTVESVTGRLTQAGKAAVITFPARTPRAFRAPRDR